jgi:hypothetical protein
VVDLKRRWIAGFGLLVAVLAPALAAADTVPVSLRWTSPRTGSPVAHYNVYTIVNGGPTQLHGTAPDTVYHLAVTRGEHYQVRVSGVGADGREGPLSPSSDDIYYDPIIPETGDQIPGAPALRPNFPNPFNPQTTIAYGVPENVAAGAPMTLEIYDLRGQRLRRLPVEDAPGWHSVVWNGADDNGSVRSSGQYVVRFRCGAEVATWKMTMLK